MEDNLSLVETQAVADKTGCLVSVCLVCWRPHLYRPSKFFVLPPKTCGRVSCDKEKP